jgi:serine phosphatase RsbU (regulator of sigma subunit)
MAPTKRDPGSTRGRTSASGRNQRVTNPAVSPGRASPGRVGTVTPGRSGSPGHAKAISDRQAQSDTGAFRTTQSGKARTGGKPKGRSLRAKFMLVLSVVTAAAMVVLGLSMSATTNKYLFSQKQHDGLELAKMATELASSVALLVNQYQQDHQEQLKNGIPSAIKDRDKLASYFKDFLTRAVTWQGAAGASDVVAISLNCPDKQPKLSGMGYGEQETDNTPIDNSNYTRLFLPKDGRTIDIPPGVQVFKGRKKTSNGEIPIYRFKVALDPLLFGNAPDQRFDNQASIRVDIDASSVDQVNRNLTFAITLAVLLAIGVVIAVANWLAGTITRPVHILLKDMQAVARGNLDHGTKAHSSDEIGILANEFNRMTENLKEAQSALVEQEKAEYELSIAREVQKQLLPAEPPLITGFDCADFYQGAKAVSGDYYDFIPLGNGLWGFIVADVSGKGIPGSMVMAVTRTIVRLIAVKHQNSAADTLKETNRLIAKQIKRGMFVTAFYAILDERTGSLSYASAGHNPMIIYRASERACELATGKGIALGFNEGPIFDKTIQEHRTLLKPGDVILLYTDGFPEAMNAQNQEFGDERFYQLVNQFGALDARSLISRLVDSVAKHRGEAEQSDDLTLIVVRKA